MTTLRRALAAVVIAPLVLGLAACGSSEEGDAAPPRGEPIAPIAAPAGSAWVETAAETPEGGFRIGNPEAPLKLVEYASHTCHVCADFAKTGAMPLDEYVATGVVSYEIRNLIRDPVDLTIAMLARCSGPGAFHPLANQAWQNFDPLMATIQGNGAAIQQALDAPEAQRFQAVARSSGLLEFFAQRGISNDQAMQCLADVDKANQIAQNSDSQAQELQISGTPTFFLNGARVSGTNWAMVEAALQNAGARD